MLPELLVVVSVAAGLTLSILGRNPPSSDAGT